MSEPRIIKKYPNRRLYDTEVSSYITLEDVRKLVINKIAVKVIDARTQEDITHSTLLQIILEQEEKGPSLFSTESLQQLICFYSGSMQSLLGKLFEQGMAFFTEQQHLQREGQIGAKSANWDPEQPLQALSGFAKDNLDHWQKLQQQWLTAFQSMAPSASEPEEPKVKEEKLF